MHRALLIGVADYDHRDPLDGPRADVPALAQRWEGLDYIVERAMGYVPAAELQSLVVDFLGRLYLLGSDVRSATGGLSLSLIFDHARGSRASVAIVLDCCHAGAAIEPTAFQAARADSRTLLVLGAAGPRTPAREVNGLGPLSAALIATIGAIDDPGAVSLGAIFEQARARCRQERPGGDPSRAQSAFVFALSNVSVPLVSDPAIALDPAPRAPPVDRPSTPAPGASDASGPRPEPAAPRRVAALVLGALMVTLVVGWRMWPSAPPGPPIAQVLLEGRTRLVDRDEVTAEMVDRFRPGMARPGLPFDVDGGRTPASAVSITAADAQAYCEARAMTLPSVADYAALELLRPPATVPPPPTVAARDPEAAKAWLLRVDQGDVRGDERIRGLGTRAAEWARVDGKQDIAYVAIGDSTLPIALLDPTGTAGTWHRLGDYVQSPSRVMSRSGADPTLGFRCISP